MTTLTLFGGMAAVLLLATLVSAALKHAVAGGRPHAAIDSTHPAPRDRAARMRQQVA